MYKIIVFTISSLALSGCAAPVQQITRLSEKPTSICVVKHDAVKEGVLTAITSELQFKGYKTAVIQGRYTQRHNVWQPQWLINEAKTAQCDALMFYVANWRWDLASYMAFANIWMTDINGQKNIGQATYDSTNSAFSTSKFINADAKIRELINQLAM
ncbi:Sbal_3080 family lipoprotein [Shewanella sp. SW32]|uniref:Sbal_3080 family lipoprotein n=1 Tax=unclassified Shewanella TaxID=196818 RepID=UPI0021DA2189|nr:MULTISPECIES: Sbal_3080 family lipoprotein [unclassified Shewanella]MCU7962393.1 Sbal_3080 family lipoprotein [Shewanella sp. SW32]MCU7971302.1 Sbal_3080 family lipoprotein [Shewanella sp. SW29]